MYAPGEDPVKYIQYNFERHDRLAIVLIDRRAEKGDPRAVEQQIRSAEAICADGYQRWLRYANASEHKDIFISMSSLKPDAYGRTKRDIDQIRHIFLDFDEGGIAAVNRVIETPGMPTPHHILHTSPEKYQMIWSVAEFSMEQAEGLAAGMVDSYGADIVVKDISRVLRLPGFRNNKLEEMHFVKDVATEIAAKQDYTPADFPAFEMKQRQARDIKQASPGSFAGSGNIDRSQSGQDFHWVMQQLEAGRSRSEIYPELVKMAARKPDPVYYADATLDKAEARYGYNQSIGKYQQRYHRVA